MAINVICISGNLVRDSEYRETQTGLAVLRATVAVDDRYKDPKTGEWVNDPSFLDIVFFAERARSLQQYLVKGTKVSLAGKLKQHHWVDPKTNEKRSRVEIHVGSDFEFMSPRVTNAADPTTEADVTDLESVVDTAAADRDYLTWIHTYEIS